MWWERVHVLVFWCGFTAVERDASVCNGSIFRVQIRWPLVTFQLLHRTDVAPCRRQYKGYGQWKPKLKENCLRTTYNFSACPPRRHKQSGLKRCTSRNFRPFPSQSPPLLTCTQLRSSDPYSARTWQLSTLRPNQGPNHVVCTPGYQFFSSRMWFFTGLPLSSPSLA